ncbi:unnamed protein product [Phytomonas sp. Hart1]|nr:unnamed protein product [Phytomonas sp. Hart1]|eukprot:CCW68186.1 unnamed protein product [Phytomonas sp. isolate Hart1]
MQTPEVSSPQSGLNAIESNAQTVRNISAAVKLLEDYGLSFDTSAVCIDTIEQILMTDSWVCGECGSSNEPLCPHSSKPHRRRLVLIAQEILQWVGRKVGRMCKRPAPLRERVDGDVKIHTRRRVMMKPHLLLLAFHLARLDTKEVPEMFVQCAQHVLDILRQLQTYGKRLKDQMNESYSKNLLKSFSSAWLQYAKLAEHEVQKLSSLEQRLSVNRLFDGTKSALLEAARERAKSTPNERADLTTFMDLLYQRIERVALPEQLREVQSELSQIEASISPMDSGLRSEQAKIETTQGFQYMNPLISDANTSGSEMETAKLQLLAPGAATPVMGPELPPHWYVDATGRSRPEPGYEERQRRELFLNSEFKARKAFEAVLHYTPPKTTEEGLREAVALGIDEVQLTVMARQLNQSTPVVDMIPPLLHQIQEALLLAVPARLRYRLEQQFRDALDWSWMIKRTTQNQHAMSRIVQFVINHVIVYGAPAREEELKAECQKVCRNLDRLHPELGAAVAEAFRFLFKSVYTLRRDVAEYSLSIVAGELQTNAITYIRAFIEQWLPAPRQWQSSIAFLQKFINTESVKDWAVSKAACSSTSLTDKERRLRGALHFGAMDLLRSGGCTRSERWEFLPGELFYFDKTVIFSCANTVQECILLLLLEGTASVMLSSRGFNNQQVSDALKALHEFFLELLTQDLKLNTLKQSAIDFLETRLSAAPFKESSTQKPVTSNTLSEAERNVLSSTIDKMTDTNSSLYISFERKVLHYTELILFSTSPGSLLPMGLVTNILQRQMGLLKSALTFHWEVYRPYYRTLEELLTFES